jgi:hypothetical protein
MNTQALLEEIFVGQERLTRSEIRRRAAAADASTQLVAMLDVLPEGEYAEDELIEALAQVTELQPDMRPLPTDRVGIPGSELADADLQRELGELHRTRNDTLRHGSDNALANHNERLAELEEEYLRRFPAARGRPGPHPSDPVMACPFPGRRPTST